MKTSMWRENRKKITHHNFLENITELTNNQEKFLLQFVLWFSVTLFFYISILKEKLQWEIAPVLKGYAWKSSMRWKFNVLCKFIANNFYLQMAIEYIRCFVRQDVWWDEFLTIWCFVAI